MIWPCPFMLRKRPSSGPALLASELAYFLPAACLRSSCPCPWPSCPPSQVAGSQVSPTLQLQRAEKMQLVHFVCGKSSSPENTHGSPGERVATLDPVHFET